MCECLKGYTMNEKWGNLVSKVVQWMKNCMMDFAKEITQLMFFKKKLMKNQGKSHKMDGKLKKNVA